MDSSPGDNSQMAESEGDSEKSELGIVQTQYSVNSTVNRVMVGSSIEQSLSHEIWEDEANRPHTEGTVL